MTTFNTRNPIGSTAAKDLYDNAENLDVAVNDLEKDTWEDRFGIERPTLSGQDRTFNLFIDESSDAFQRFLIHSGYENIGDYAEDLEITARNQIFWKDGEIYRASALLALPYTTTGDWAVEANSFVAVGDQIIRQEFEAYKNALSSLDVEYDEQMRVVRFNKGAGSIEVTYNEDGTIASTSDGLSTASYGYNSNLQIVSRSES